MRHIKLDVYFNATHYNAHYHLIDLETIMPRPESTWLTALIVIGSLACAASANSQTQRPDAKSKQRAEAIKQLRMEEERGYKRISFNDFKLDGAALAKDEAKVAITALYLKVGNAEYIFPSLLAISSMRERRTLDAAIGLLTDDAPRELRSYFLNCRNNPVTSQIGCSVNILARAVLCSQTTSTDSAVIPCLLVDDGWILRSGK